MRTTSPAVLVEVEAVRVEIARCTRERVPFNMRAFLESRGAVPDASAVRQAFRRIHGETMRSMCARLREPAPANEERTPGSPREHAAALKAHIDDLAAKGAPMRWGLVNAFCRTRRVPDNTVRSAFERVYSMGTTEYIVEVLVERARAIKAGCPLIKRGPLAARLGVGEDMVDRVLAAMTADRAEAAE